MAGHEKPEGRRSIIRIPQNTASPEDNQKKREKPIMAESKTLLFIYNTNNGVLKSLMDYCAGTASAPVTPACPLNAITTTPGGMKEEWKRFLKDLKIPSRLLDRNEFSWEFHDLHTTFPVVLVQSGADIAVLVGTEALNQCRDLNDLIHLMQERLSHGMMG
jgi:hypothetical protein